MTCLIRPLISKERGRATVPVPKKFMVLERREDDKV
jgi:hypothetical protein